MNPRRMIGGALVAMACAVTVPALAVAPAMAATTYSNCSAMHEDYPHGVGKPGAVDSTSGTPVTDFTVDADLYNANKKSDRDGDGIACEKN